MKNVLGDLEDELVDSLEKENTRVNGMHQDGFGSIRRNMKANGISDSEIRGARRGIMSRRTKAMTMNGNDGKGNGGDMHNNIQDESQHREVDLGKLGRETQRQEA